ncbi:transposase [Endozoicomonas sp. 2B-B]
MTGKNYGHRRQWIVDKLRELVSIFSIEVCAYAVMSNHYHVVLHINEKPAREWGRDEILSRWTRLFTGLLLVQRYLAADQLSHSELTRVDEFAEEYRNRLTNISWFMRCLNEYLAREANQEDDCKGRFWEGRFKSQALLDEAALLTCMAYVDLNPLRAEMSETPEGSDYTSIQERIENLAGSDTRKQPVPLMPFRSQGQNPAKALPYILHDYLELVDWSGRAVRSDKKGSIPSDIPPILSQLEIDSNEWLKTMRWNNRFYRAVGRLEAMKTFAREMGRQWVQGLFTCSRLFHGVS